jgi:hypothetical protein
MNDLIIFLKKCISNIDQINTFYKYISNASVDKLNNKILVICGNTANGIDLIQNKLIDIFGSKYISFSNSALSISGIEQNHENLKNKQLLLFNCSSYLCQTIIKQLSHKNIIIISKTTDIVKNLPTDLYDLIEFNKHYNPFKIIIDQIHSHIRSPCDRADLSNFIIDSQKGKKIKKIYVICSYDDSIRNAMISNLKDLFGSYAITMPETVLHDIADPTIYAVKNKQLLIFDTKKPIQTNGLRLLLNNKVIKHKKLYKDVDSIPNNANYIVFINSMDPIYNLDDDLYTLSILQTSRFT